MTRALFPARAALVLLLLSLTVLTARLTFRKKPRSRHRPPQVARVDFTRHVRPVLEARCVRCHGPSRANGGLRLDTPAHILKGGNSGLVVVPKQAQHSLLVEVLTGANEAPRMPPAGRPLNKNQADLIRLWIDGGAQMPAGDVPEASPTPAHWAFQPPAVTAPPAAGAWGRGPIDAFLARHHAEQGLTPAPPAPPAALLRRVYLDLVGLPPTREETLAFLRDPSEAAYEKVVDQLLASPRHGERWGRHWMDVWRYSDPDGRKAHKDIWWSNPHIWRWRDWIVSSVNAGKGYDRMVLEMLAGDELAPRDPEALAGTGFLVRSWFKLNRNIWLNNTVEHTAKAFLGLTVGCARCHDHKSDPISQKDYYRFRAFFEPHDIRTDPLPGGGPKDQLTRALDLHHKSPTHVFVRGDERKPIKDVVIRPGVPRALGGALRIEPVPVAARRLSTGRRLALARWIVAPDNPLAARVAVNHVWMRHVGQPLVENVADLGTASRPPRHQALLDWLARQLISHDWDLKWLHRAIVTSAAYRMHSAVTSETVANLQADPENRRLWRYPSRRLEGEAIRDGLLHLAGALDLTMGGAPADFANDTVPGRRSLYYRYSREDKLAFLNSFDPASVEECYRRQTSVVPQQALALTSSDLAWQAARRTADRLAPGSQAPAAFTARAFEHVLGRPPTAPERAACVEFLAAQATRRAPGLGEAEAWRRARERLVHALLNHNDFITVR